MKRVRFVLGCRQPHLSDKAGDTFVLGLIAVGVICLCGYAISRNAAAESAAWTAVLMAIINTIKEGRQQRSAERTIQQVAPTAGGAAQQ